MKGNCMMKNILIIDDNKNIDNNFVVVHVRLYLNDWNLIYFCERYYS